MDYRKEYRKQPKVKNMLKDIMLKLEQFNKEGIINTLSVQPSGMNDYGDYIRVSFKIPNK